MSSPSITPISAPSAPLSNLIIPETTISSIRRQGSRSSHKSSLVPSPRPSYANLNDHASESSPSGSHNGSFNSTPRILSRRGSQREVASTRQGHAVETDSRSEVIETVHVRMDRDPGTGRKTINQYVVLHELGYGTHGQVRLGQEIDPVTGDAVDRGQGSYYAIKIVDRNPKRKRLTGFSRQRTSNPGKLVNESEIRKEIAIFKKVNHPNVVRMHEIIDDPDNSKLFMILEYCENGEIAWKDEDGPALSVAETRRIFRQTVLGLEYLHHQGIIHRDIKPSNLLLSMDGTVKISDFGCSHYSEALREASAQPEAEGYVDDIELAKTAGSPAFFAPEMCYSGLEPELELRVSHSLHNSPRYETPEFTLRPPSIVGPQTQPEISPSDPAAGSSAYRNLSMDLAASNDSDVPRPNSIRSGSTITLPRRERLPITNAIDVWALGVTLYCLLFGKTPFVAANEYLLMQVIPVVDIDYPNAMGKDALEAGTQEGEECLDLLRRLLEKDPKRRITLEQAKRHPFTLRDLPDPTAWLLKNDIHAQSFVTVSNDEVARVVGRKRLSERVGVLKNKVKTKLFGSRDRSSSIGTAESSSQPGSIMHAREPSPNPTPTMPGLVRRLSLLGSGSMSPRRNSPVVASQSSLLAVVSPNEHHSPRPTLAPDPSQKLVGLPNTLRRQASNDNDAHVRPKSPNAAGSTIGNRLARLLSRSGSQRSKQRQSNVPPINSRRASTDGFPRRRSTEVESRSPEGLGIRPVWETRLKAGNLARRNSNLSEEFRDFEEEVDWHEPLSDDEDYDPPPIFRPGGRDFEPDWQHRRTVPSQQSTPERVGTPLRSNISRESMDDDGLAISVGSRRRRDSSLRMK